MSLVPHSSIPFDRGIVGTFVDACKEAGACRGRVRSSPSASELSLSESKVGVGNGGKAKTLEARGILFIALNVVDVIQPFPLNWKLSPAMLGWPLCTLPGAVLAPPCERCGN